jgi:hypothetical protein
MLYGININEDDDELDIEYIPSENEVKYNENEKKG